MSAAGEDAARHCLDLVRGADKDRFLAGLFAPGEGRRSLFALYAFNIELTRVRDMVSEPQLGEMRLTWWHDVVAAIYRGEVTAHPVAEELARAIEAGGLPQAGLVNMIEARRGDLYDDPVPTLGDLEGYLGETASALMQMGALVARRAARRRGGKRGGPCRGGVRPHRPPALVAAAPGARAMFSARRSSRPPWPHPRSRAVGALRCCHGGGDC